MNFFFKLHNVFLRCVLGTFKLMLSFQLKATIPFKAYTLADMLVR